MGRRELCPSLPQTAFRPPSYPPLRARPCRRFRFLQRITAAEEGNFGDCEPVGEGVSEMRIHYGPGYRLYFTRRGETIYFLMVGGDKSTQKRDIRKAIEMAREIGKDPK